MRLHAVEQQSLQLKGQTHMRNALLKWQNCTVASLPHWRWTACRNQHERRALLREVLDPVAALPTKGYSPPPPKRPVNRLPMSHVAAQARKAV